MTQTKMQSNVMNPDTLLSPMHRTIKRNLLKYAAGRAIFCPICETIMDWKKTVLITFPSGGTRTSCTSCFDKEMAKAKAEFPRRDEPGAWDKALARLDILDGRLIAKR